MNKHYLTFRQQLHSRVTKHVTLPCTVCSLIEQNTIFIQAAAAAAIL